MQISRIVLYKLNCPEHKLTYSPLNEIKIYINVSICFIRCSFYVKLYVVEDLKRLIFILLANIVEMKKYLLFKFWFERMSWSRRLVVDFRFSSTVIHKKYIYRYVFQPHPPRVFDFSVYPWQQYFLRSACYHLSIYCWRQKLMIDLHCLDLESF